MESIKPLHDGKPQGLFVFFFTFLYITMSYFPHELEPCLARLGITPEGFYYNLFFFFKKKKYIIAVIKKSVYTHL